MEGLTIESLGFPSTSLNVPFLMAYLTMVNIQPANLLENYSLLVETIGLDRPLTDPQDLELQCSEVKLNSFSITQMSELKN